MEHEQYLLDFGLLLLKMTSVSSIIHPRIIYTPFSHKCPSIAHRLLSCFSSLSVPCCYNTTVVLIFTLLVSTARYCTKLRHTFFDQNETTSHSHSHLVVPPAYTISARSAGLENLPCFVDPPSVRPSFVACLSAAKQCAACSPATAAREIARASASAWNPSRAPAAPSALAGEYCIYHHRARRHADLKPRTTRWVLQSCSKSVAIPPIGFEVHGGAQLRLEIAAIQHM